MSNDNDDIIACDIGNTLNIRQAIPLAKKLAELKAEKIHIVLVTEEHMESMDVNLFLIGKLGLHIDKSDVIAKNMLGVPKSDPRYWERFLASFKKDKNAITFIDDDGLNCANAEKNGIDTIRFDPEKVDDVIARLDRKFHPSL